MNRKKLLLPAIIVFSIMALMCIMTACEKGSGGKVPGKEDEVLSTFNLNKQEIELEVFTSFVLTPEDGIAPESITWSSTDEDIASVKDGKVTALRGGSSTIIARSGKKEGKCVVSVLDLGEYPTLKLSGDNFSIKVGKQTFVQAEMQFKGEILDATYSYSTDDESIAKFNDGIIEGVGEGKTKVYVTGKYLSAESVREIQVDVSENVNFTVSANSVELAISEPSADYKKSLNIETSVYKNDEQVTNPQIVWESNHPDFVSVDNGLITALKETKNNDVEVRAHYTSDSGNIFTCIVSVRVVVPSVNSQFTTAVELNKDTAKSVVIDMAKADIDCTRLREIVDVESNETIKFSKSGEKLTIEKNQLYSGERKWCFKLDDVDYISSVKVVTKYIKTKSDIDNMEKYARADKKSRLVTYEGESKPRGYIYYGYFELVNDIDYGGDEIGQWCSKSVYGSESSEYVGFHGTFDGRGHVLSNFHTGIESNGHYFAGLFGILGKNGVVRNLVITDSKVHCCSGLIAGIMGGTIENVSITGRLMGGNWDSWQYSGLVAARCTETARVRNVVVRSSIETDSPAYNEASAFGTIDYGGIYENVIGVGLPQAYVEGKRWGVAKAHDGAGIVAYESLAAMKGAGNIFGDWDASLWDFSGDFPVVKPQ